MNGNRIVIRAFDLLFSVTALVIFFPILLFLAFLIFLNDGSPVIFSQERAGRSFKSFRIYKFRTMLRDSEDEKGLTEGSDDLRITRTGKFLRKSKLDELPQFFNVLLGDMSIVGPRPQVFFYAEKFKEYYRIILSEKPGLLSTSALVYYNEDAILDKVANPTQYYEDVLVPVKCEMDIQLISDFSIQKYFFVLKASFIKIILKRQNL